MSKKPRYLTKSRYKLAMECPTKLFYTGNKDYFNKKMDDPFLQALAEGGFQVGALATSYYPGGHDIETLSYNEALAQTNELLKQENIVIFEAAIKYDDLFIRVDILEKKGDKVNLIEVKSKSANPATFHAEIWDKRKLKNGTHSLNSKWKPYIYDVAFQTYVTEKAFPEWEVEPFLMCADKSAAATVEGLNQKFFLDKSGSQIRVVTPENLTKEDLGAEILTLLELRDVVNTIFSGDEESPKVDDIGFVEGIAYYSEMYKTQKKISPAVGTHCKNCEFRGEESGKRNGFSECWMESTKLSAEYTKFPFVFDVWFSPKANELLKDGKYLMSDIEEEDYNIVPRSSGSGLSRSERQWLQVSRERNEDSSVFFNMEDFRKETEEYVYPLHFIDFETTMVALPFFKGAPPYMQTLFQFSHHVLHKDGKLEHKGQCLIDDKGIFPNFEVVRQLKAQLSTDSGTIFRYSNHENTVLCQIREQLISSEEKDKDDLIEFIESITEKKAKSKTLWSGERNMIDLCDLVQRFYYNPSTKGSNSLKYVLPAIMNDSDYLKQKYSKPIYGSDIKSLNFENKKWIELEADGSVRDPYLMLPPVFDEYDRGTLDLLMSDDELRNGGAAMTGWSLMQFSQMSQQEREKIRVALLKYCELDTLAMVMIWEYWQDLLKQDEASTEAA